ncbi:hypothetical protein GCM10010994_31890 [Chelatococcus reniformis]|uniref:Uncharacterized protein n=1 Tax=Chelatococcus reniformis TaxID=1494448 RepID=A0A916UFM5_9HYPH|nr:hypothetical protein GCM10010994_31890 [Chelatococcus reniformis]
MSASFVAEPTNCIEFSVGYLELRRRHPQWGSCRVALMRLPPPLQLWEEIGEMMPLSIVALIAISAFTLAVSVWLIWV